MAKNGLAKRNKADIAPKHIAEGNEGLETVGTEDLLIPRLVIMQALSPQVQDGDRKEGEVINSLTQEVWIPNKKKIEFVPVFYFKEWIEWGDRDSNEGILARSLDPNGELAMSVQQGEKNAKGQMKVTMYHNFISVFPELGLHQPAIIPCCRSNHKHGRRLLGLAKYRGNYPLFAGLYSIGTQKEKNQNNQQYFAWEFENAGWVEENLYPAIQELHGTLKSMQWKDAGPVEEAEEKVDDEI